MTQYIDKAAVVEEIEKLTDKVCDRLSTEAMEGAIVLSEYIISSLDTLEVKEVDLDKEIKKEYLERRCYGGRDNMLVILNEPQFNEIAKHFFELGLKVQKGEEV